MGNAARYRRPLALVLLDADDMAAINETHGRAAGDECLRAVARAILSTVRKADRVARIGDDDFAILLPETRRSSLESFVDRLVVWIGSERYAVADRLESPAVSIGSSVYPDESLDAASLLRAADRDLYMVKRLKRTPVGSEDG